MNFPTGQFNVIYADPPWSYKMWGDDGYEKSPDKHYDCMNMDDLKGLRDTILFAAAPDCVLFMWAVFPMLPEAIELMREWGFKYKTGGAWHKRSKTWTPECEEPKTAFGTGYIFRSACEPYLVGTIGNPKIKNKSTRNIIDAYMIEDAVREHSRKPDGTIELIEDLFEGDYLELFGRTQRPGWTVWGNQTDKFSEAI